MGAEHCASPAGCSTMAIVSPLTFSTEAPWALVRASHHFTFFFCLSYACPTLRLLSLTMGFLLLCHSLFTSTILSAYRSNPRLALGGPFAVWSGFINVWGA